jgi:uncharacterized membrane protein
LRRALLVQMEPTLDEDVAYGIRLLVDIAVRSLSESPFQDPTTAVQAIDRIHDLLRQLVRRPFPDGVHRDEHGVARVTVPTMTWDAFLTLAVEEIRLAGAGSPQITRRLKAALDDVRALAPRERVAAVDRHLDLLAASATRAIDNEDDRDFALTADPKGIGGSSDRRLT